MTEKHPYKYQEIAVGDIHIDKRYQRNEKPVVKRIMGNFDYHLVNPVKVVFRDGNYYAFDGQQTTIALRNLFGPEYLAPCMVYYDVPEWIDEAQLFEGTNDRTAKDPVTDAERWHSRIERGDQAAMDIIQLAEDAGLHVSVYHGKDHKAIKATAALDYIYATYSRWVVSETFNILSDAFHGDANSLKSPMLRGMAMFVDKYRGEYVKKQLIDRLNKNGPVAILQAGKASAANGKIKYAREILAVYNRGRKNPLPDKF